MLHLRIYKVVIDESIFLQVIAFVSIATKRNSSQIKETNDTYVLNLKNDDKANTKFIVAMSVDPNKRYTFKASK